MWIWVVISVMAVGAIAIITEARNESKRIELKRLNKEIELEKLRLENYDKETEKMKLELEYTKQQLIETRQPIDYLEKK
jgi:HAMP domain-containing protein